MMVVLCAARWRACVRNKFKTIASTVIDFISSACSSATKDLSSVDSKACSLSLFQTLRALVVSNYNLQRYSAGVQIIGTLMEEISYVNMRCDVLCALIPAVKQNCRFHFDNPARRISGPLDI